MKFTKTASTSAYCVGGLPIESHAPLLHAAVMLTAKRSVGITSEVNLRLPLHAGKIACMQGSTLVFETQGRHHKKCETGVSVAPNNILCPKN